MKTELLMQTFLKRNKHNNASTKIPQFGGFFYFLPFALTRTHNSQKTAVFRTFRLALYVFVIIIFINLIKNNYKRIIKI